MATKTVRQGKQKQKPSAEAPVTEEIRRAAERMGRGSELDTEGDEQEAETEEEQDDGASPVPASWTERPFNSEDTVNPRAAVWRVHLALEFTRRFAVSGSETEVMS